LIETSARRPAKLCTEEHKSVATELKRRAHELIGASAHKGGFRICSALVEGWRSAQVMLASVIVTDGLYGMSPLKTGEALRNLLSDFMRESLKRHAAVDAGAYLPAAGAAVVEKANRIPRPA